MDALADLADRVSSGAVRVTHDQNLVLGEVRQIDLLRDLAGAGGAEPGDAQHRHAHRHDLLPGLDFCSLANAGSIGIAKQIHERFNDFDYLYDLGHIEIKMSGCMNACGHHHVGHIGILGVDKHGEEWYQITLGGSVSGISSLGEVIGPSVAKTEVAETIAKLLDVYVEQREDGEEFLDACGASASRRSAKGCMAQLIKGRALAANDGVAGTLLPLADYLKAMRKPASRRASAACC